MFKLDKFYPMYSDPDSTYEKVKDSLGVKSKKEFLDKLCFTNTGDSLIQVIKVMLKKEQPSYDEEHNLKYTNLIEILNALEIFIDTKKFRTLEDVVSLNSLFLELMVSKVSDSDSDLPSDFIDKMFFKDKDIQVLDGKDLFSKYGEVTSFSKMYRGKVLTVKLNEDFTNDFFIINIETSPKLSKVKPNAFLTKCLNLCPALNKSDYDFKGNIIFCSKKLVKDGRLFNRKIKYNPKVKNGDEFIEIITTKGFNVVLV